ncbi:MAG: hypothetical protein N2Z79_00325, partial [Candidatus Omnitrophica bacterium]|nr:hypothetical protein [Candidatus Omnitrophota bacterium]
MDKTLVDKYKSAIDAENVIYLFYKYIADNAKNQNVKKNFSRLFREAKLHQRLLRIILKDSFRQDYKPLIDACRDKGLCPERFSLLGVINIAKDTEESAVNFYKQI